jgi:hypothetical protein
MNFDLVLIHNNLRKIIGYLISVTNLLSTKHGDRIYCEMSFSIMTAAAIHFGVST